MTHAAARLIASMLACLAMLAPLPAAAQDYPTKTIKLIVGYPPGGSNDIVARIIARPLAEILGATVIVENRAGASGTIGADLVAKSPPDGYTLLAASASPVVITPHTIDKPPFNAITDFTPINTVGITPEAIAVGPKLAVASLKELLAVSRTRQISLSSSGSGGLPHLTIELLRKVPGNKIVHVPYKGAGPAVTDTLAGHVDGIVMDLPPLYALIKDGRLKALAVTSDKRVEFLSDVPTAREELPNFSVVNWVGVFAPAHTPAAIIEKLNAALVKIVALPEVREQLVKNAVVPQAMASPAAFQKFVAEENERWGKLVREVGVKAD